MEAPHFHHTRLTQGKNLPVINPNSDTTHTCLFKKGTVSSKYSVNPECDCSQGHHTPAKTIKSSRTAGTFHNQLAKVNKGLDTIMGYEIEFISQPYQFKRPHPSLLSQNQQKLVSQEISEMISKGAITELQTPPESGFFSTLFLVPKKDGGQRPVINLKKPQFIHTCPSFQNGGNSYPQKPVKKGRLACKDRPKGRFFLSPDKSKSQEVSLLPIQQQVLPIQLSPLQPGLSPMGLYQDPEADSSSLTRAGDTVGAIHRRHSPDGRDQGEGQGPCVRPDIPFAMLRIHNKLGEDNPRTIPTPRILGFYGGHYQHGAEPPNSENKKVRAESRQLLEAEHVTCRALSMLIGKMNATNQVIPPAPLFYRS